MLFFNNWPSVKALNKKALNKSKRFVINQKAFPLARMKDSLKNTISVDQKLLPFESVSEKIKENGFH